MSRKYTPEEIEFAKEQIKQVLPKGGLVYGIIRSVSKSGMSREIDLYAIKSMPNAQVKNNAGQLAWQPKLVYLTDYVSTVLGWPRKNKSGYPNGGLIVKGTGMDMLFYTVHRLGSALYDDNHTFSYEAI
ncbi:MAG: hypothetical protein LBI48_09615 [Burkholderiaceae bacterium]|jgi:hypothetical protein|nr:hypothetical protein [Burkholderiaceae bacterium]